LEQGHVRLVQHVDEEQHGRHDFPSAGPQSRKSHDCSGTPLRLPGAQAQIRRRFALIPVAIRSTSAIAAYGAFIAPIVIGDQIKAGTPQFAMYGFAIFYALCLFLNWWFYLRTHAYVKNP